MEQLFPLLRLARTCDADSALREIVLAALEITRSRNGLIAVLDEEDAALELRSGGGSEWDDSLAEERLDVTPRSGIVAYVAATGKAFMTPDVSQESHYLQLYASTRSEAAAPIRDRFDRILGVINVESDQKSNYTEADLKALSVLGEVAATVLEREEAATREKVLIEIGHALDKARTEEELLQEVVRTVSEVLRFQAFAIFLYDRANANYVLRAAVGKLKAKVGELSMKAGEGIVGGVAQSKRPWMGHDPASDPRWRNSNNELPDDQISSYLAVPVVSRGQCLAVLRVLRKVPENRYLDNRFTDLDVTLLTAIAEQMAVGLDNVRSLQRLLHSERMAAWGESSAKSSHMIGNRVFALRGDVNELGHMLEEPQLDREELQAIHKSLKTSVDRIAEILQDFRDFLTATHLKPVAVDLNEVVESAVREVFPKRSAVTLEFDLGPLPGPVNLDPDRARRAFGEIVENAMGFVEQGGIRVSTRVAPPEVLQNVKKRHGEMAMVVIEDTGPGVGEDNKETIFQPFHTGRVKGMGLGLSIVRGIVEAHDGVVYEDGKPGDGARFVILLPLLDRS